MISWFRFLPKQIFLGNFMKSNPEVSPKSSRTPIRSLLLGMARDRRGTTAIIFAIMVIPTMSLVGAALDFTHAFRLKQSMTNAIDAAALAAGSALDLTNAQRTELAESYVQANLSQGASETVGAPTVTITDKTITVSIDATIDTAMLGVVGIDTISVQATNEVKLSDTKLEVALVLDMTGSMAGSKLASLKASAKDLIDILYTSNSSEEFVKVGIVPFADFINVGQEYENASWITLDQGDNINCQLFENAGMWWYENSCNQYKNNPGSWQGCVRPRDNPNHTNDADAVSAKITGIFGGCGISQVMPLSNNPITLRAKISSLGAQGWTYIPAGLAWGWRILSPNEPFTDVVSYDDEEWTKALVLMTDGANTVNFGYTGADANTQTAELCTNIKAAGIKIYTIAFEVNDSTTKDMLKDCASSPSDYYDSSDSTALASAFKAIGVDLANLRLSK